jgi:transcriptional regulator with XRE-family HTH domain
MVYYTKAEGNGVGLAIRSIRERRKLSQAALALLLGCSQNAVSRYEAGHPPSLRPLRKLLDLAHESEVRVILARLQDIGAVLPNQPPNIARTGGECDV